LNRRPSNPGRLASAASGWSPDPRGDSVPPSMRTIGNILWLLFAGVWLALGYALSGVLLGLTIIGIPFAVQAFKLAGFTLWPFGRRVVRAEGDPCCLALGFNVLWL